MRTARKACVLIAVLMIAVATMTPARAAIKPKAIGVQWRDSLPTGATADTWKSVVNSATVKVTWASLQPQKNGFTTAPIDTLLSQAATLNIDLRLRIMTGYYAPGWVSSGFSYSCGSVQLDQGDGVLRTVPRWWTTCYTDLYSALMKKLAGAFDRTANVHAVSVCAGMTFFCEPMQRQVFEAPNPSDGKTNCQRLLETTYTYALDRSSMLTMVNAHKQFANTRSFLAFNPYQYCDATGGHVEAGSLTNTLALMDAYRTALGTRAILQNNSIRSSWICPTCTMPPSYGVMYDHMVQLGKPISFQTAGSVDVGDLPSVLTWAASKKADAVELPGNFMNYFANPSELQPYDTALQNNA